jgi:hypothetical protein
MPWIARSIQFRDLQEKLNELEARGYEAISVSPAEFGEFKDSMIVVARSTCDACRPDVACWKHEPQDW